MGVYIENMEMPPPGTFNIVHIHCDGQVFMPSWGKGMTQVNGVKAFPVPPHGRLGDLDKLADNMRSATAGMEHRAIIMHEIRRAPTIIPAKGGET